ncbi:RNA polymerase sigma factor [Sedimentitalea sp. JM2-8]|uniref:RNA polymerase sigma factor n=1 Tax=Sedimentitalea xiamensis TaxID=3050037 RepID=A0ABT7FHN4_9RHOB|nr:RNA polymerase sigma factor [Sedimentitalea xiamensis]MDK3074650.1 RNA polymerase sigma factor [Sedimentitalea xiamensis]
MPVDARQPVDEGSAVIRDLYKRDGRRVYAALVRLLGDFDRAEEATQIAFLAAASRWPAEGVPRKPVQWLISAGRFRMIDQMRRDRRMTQWSDEAERAVERLELQQDPETIEDDRLRLIFTCCHPSLSEEAAVAMTLREVCGLATEAIASAFLVAPPTLAQRIVRAKSKIRDACIPYEVPDTDELPRRLDRVLRVVYLAFTEGHSSSGGENLVQADLMAEAIRLGRLILKLLPEAEVQGLLALMILQHARHAARMSPGGDLIPLDEQDRGLWDHAAIAEGAEHARQALLSGRSGPYTLQAAIAASHAEAPRFEDTDWAEIAGLYAALLRIEPSPVIALNHAVAIAMRDGPETGLALIEPLLQADRLGRYHLAHAARADLLRRMGRTDAARQSYETARDLATQEAERRFITRRLAEIGP